MCGGEMLVEEAKDYTSFICPNCGAKSSYPNWKLGKEIK